MAVSNLDLLKNAKMVPDPGDLTPDDLNAIEAMSRDDLMALIGIWMNLPEDFRDRIIERRSLIF